MSYDSQPPTVPFTPGPPPAASPFPARRRSRRMIVSGIGAGALALALAIAGGAYAAGFTGEDEPAVAAPVASGTADQTSPSDPGGQVVHAPSVETAPSGEAGPSGEAAPSDQDGPSGEAGHVVTAPSDEAGSTSDGGGHPEVVEHGALTVVRPDTLGGKPRIETGTTSAATGDLTFEVTASAQGIYGNAATQDVLFLIAVASTDMTPEARFSLIVSDASKEFGVDNYVSVEPGPLGGLAKCGNGNVNGVPAAVCVWSDGGSTGVLVNSLKEAAELGKQVSGLRAEVEKQQHA